MNVPLIGDFCLIGDERLVKDGVQTGRWRNFDDYHVVEVIKNQLPERVGRKLI